jgi:hypothetical protein
MTNPRCSKLAPPTLRFALRRASAGSVREAKQYQRSINRLDQIPDEELDTLARRGMNSLWLIGIWERSRASKTIKQLCGNPDAVASDLVNQTHGVKRSCMHRTLWMLLHITDLIHPVCKITACRHICEDYVARKGKDISRELVAVSCTSRNVKFHHRELVTN